MAFSTVSCSDFERRVGSRTEQGMWLLSRKVAELLVLCKFHSFPRGLPRQLYIKFVQEKYLSDVTTLQIPATTQLYIWAASQL